MDGRTDGRTGRTGVILNGPDTVNYMEPSQGEIIQKPKMQGCLPCS